MKMASFVVYDERTGDVVHVHVEPDVHDVTDREVLQHAGPPGDRALAVLRVETPLAAHGYRVVDGKLEEAGGRVGAGAAGASSGFAEPDIERQYKQVR